MKKLLSFLTILALLPASAFGVQTDKAGRLKGRVVDVAGMPIPQVQVIIQSPADSFEVSSNEDGYFEIEAPAGTYQIRSEKLPGFAATRREGVQVKAGEIVEVTIVPAVSSEGVLCSLPVTDAAIKKLKGRKSRP